MVISDLLLAVNLLELVNKAFNSDQALKPLARLPVNTGSAPRRVCASLLIRVQSPWQRFFERSSSTVLTCLLRCFRTKAMFVCPGPSGHWRTRFKNYPYFLGVFEAPKRQEKHRFLGLLFLLLPPDHGATPLVSAMVRVRNQASQQRLWCGGT